ncbi:MAG: hypothetical protein H6586_06720 [Flavobacteriales bacterium]|nr:hypothetical protein [Flavobacteriales bacterium]
MNNDKDISGIGKIEDAGKLVQGGRIDRYWEAENIRLYPQYYVGTSKIFKASWLHNSTEALQHFNLRSIEFGNWMNQEDRANFLYGAMLGLYYLALILGRKDYEMGLGGRLSISLGARGHGRAAGHYEPSPYSVINITKTQGIGVLAHEYAHAFDNLISFYSGGKKQSFVSGGRTTRKGYDEDIAKTGNYFEKQFEEFYNILYYNTNGAKTDFHLELQQKDEYWNRRNEVFARTFEVYVADKQKSKKLTNHFLVQGATGEAYPSIELTDQVAIIIRNLFSKGFQMLRSRKGNLKGAVMQITGYKGLRKTLLENADLDDTLANMQRIAVKDAYQVQQIAEGLRGNTVRETAHNIWNWLREHTHYKLDEEGIEELRTPARSIIDGQKGLSDPNYGIDCDDYTILISALLLNLGIDHEYRVVAFEEKGKFQHIYPVAIDTKGNTYVIDVVPEIPRFNYEAQPIKDIITIKMTASSLSGYLPHDATVNPIINPPVYGTKSEDMELHELSGINDAEEFRRDLQEEMNQPFSLSGIEEDLQDEALASSFLSGLGEVKSEDEADIVVSSKEDAMQLVENGLLAEVNKARQVLLQEKSKPTELSKLINVSKELSTMEELMQAWDDEDEREKVIKKAIVSRSTYNNFYKALLMSLQELESSGHLSGVDITGDEPIYLAQVPETDLSRILDEDENFKVGLDAGLHGFFKKLFNKIGAGVKKVVKAVVRYNPVTIGVRAAILGVLKGNVGNISARLIYGYLTQSQAEAHNLNLDEWRKIVDAKNKGEGFFTKIGGKSENYKNAIIKGKAAQATGLRLSGLGAGEAKANGFVNFIKGLLAKINIANLFKKKPKAAPQPNQRTTTQAPVVVTQPSINDFVDNGSSFPASSRTAAPATTDPNAPKPSIFKRMMTSTFWKDDVWAKHKKKIIIGASFITILIPLAIYLYQKWKNKQKRQLAGAKAARTRARNRKSNSSSVKGASSSRKRSSSSRRTSSRRSSTKSTPSKRSTSKSKTEPIGRGSTTVIKTPTKGQGKTRVSKMSSKQRLSLMHKIAKDLQKKFPKTKYSTLLSRASKMI